MATVNPHTTRAAGIILTAAIYNADHQNHVTNATSINSEVVSGLAARVRTDTTQGLSDAEQLQALKNLGAGILLWTKGADVASASSLALASGDYFDVTGSVTITGIQAVQIGTRVMLQFDATCLLTHHATDFVLLNNGYDMYMYAGDHAEFIEYATGDWRMISYQAYSGRGPKDAYGGNYLINGGFDIWQRGTSFTADSGTPVAYIADRWISEYGNGSASNAITRQLFSVGQTDVPGDPVHYLRISRSVAGSLNTPLLAQLIEDAETLSGTSATIQFWAKSGAAKELTVAFQQRFGSGGSPSSDVITTLQTILLSTSWQRFELVFDIPSVSGKTFGTTLNTSSLELRIQEKAGDYTTFVLDFARFAVVRTDARSHKDIYGDKERPIGTELNLCQRYYEKSYSYLVPPGSSDLNGCCAIRNSVTGSLFYGQRFKVTKRVAPAVTVYSPAGGASGNVYNASAAGNVASSVTNIGNSGYTENASIGDTNAAQWHYVADAEF